MITMSGARLLGVLSLSAAIVLALMPSQSVAQTREQAAAAPRQDQPAAARQDPTARPLNFGAQQEKINAWTVGLAAGLIEGAPLRLASEMARVVDDGAEPACPAHRHARADREPELAALSARRRSRDHQLRFDGGIPHPASRDPPATSPTC